MLDESARVLLSFPPPSGNLLMYVKMLLDSVGSAWELFPRPPLPRHSERQRRDIRYLATCCHSRVKLFGLESSDIPFALSFQLDSVLNDSRRMLESPLVNSLQINIVYNR